MRKHQILTYCLLLIATAGFCQADDVLADIEIIDDGDQVSFTAILTNNTKEDATYRYEFLTINRTQGGSNTNRQSGEVQAPPFEAINLSTTKLGNVDGLSYDCKLFIYREDELVTKVSKTSAKEEQREDSEDRGALAEPKVYNPESTLELDLGGYILDQTRTRSGRDFYELFYKAWGAHEINGSYTIEIKEVVARGRNTSIYVSIDDKLVYASGLQPKYDIIIEQVDQAVPRVLGYIQSINNYNKNLETEATF